MAWRRGLGWVVLGAGLVAAACGDGTDGQYVTNSKAGVYLRVPDDWGVFTMQAGNPTEFRAKSAGSAGAVPLPPDPWRVAFDGAEKPDRNHFEVAVPEDPIGLVEVYSLLAGEFDPALSSFQGLRTIAGGTEDDPLEREKDDDDFEVLDYAELEEGDFWGIAITYTESGEDEEGDDVQITTRRVVMIDNRLEKLHLVTIACETECYEDRQAEIDAIVDSFTLREL